MKKFVDIVLLQIGPALNLYLEATGFLYKDRRATENFPIYVTSLP